MFNFVDMFWKFVDLFWKFLDMFWKILEIFGLILYLALTDEYFSIQLWINVHTFLQFFTLRWCECVVQKRSDC